jgi:integrase
MRTPLKGINRVRKKLANGETATYYYAWKGGPRLTGKPGSPEFHQSYVDATRKPEKRFGELASVIDAFQHSTDFLDLAPRTQRDYAGKIKLIDKQFGDLPLEALSDRRTRGVFKAWRDRLARSSRRQADYAWVVLARILSWGLDAGMCAANPCERGGRLYRGSRADKIWTAEDEATFLARAPSHLHLPLILALWTGQRQGDLLRLPWSAYNGTHIRLQQGKTGRRVVIPVGSPLRALLDKTAKCGPIILATTEGTPWTEDGFRSSWRKACASAGIVGVTFHDLRGTAVTRLALVECTEPEIAAITGLSLKRVGEILDVHYLHRDPALAESAIRKLEKGTKTPN